MGNWIPAWSGLDVRTKKETYHECSSRCRFGFLVRDDARRGRGSVPRAGCRAGELLFAGRDDVVLRVGRQGVVLRQCLGWRVWLSVSRLDRAGGRAMTNATQVIWTEFGERLRGFIARRVGNEADADDVLQEVFLRIHRYHGTVERDDRLVPWLFQVTRNAIADFHRAPERRRELPAGVAGDLEFDGVDAVLDPNDLDAPTSQTWTELAGCLRPMIDRLPPDYRDAVAIVDLGGVPQREAAERAGLSVSGMKSRVQRGRQALKGLLDECCRLELDAGGRVTDYQRRQEACGPCATENGTRSCQ